VRGLALAKGRRRAPPCAEKQHQETAHRAQQTNGPEIIPIRSLERIR
jgi:hypothetical protein